jgi:hypothetical protein
MVGHMVFRVVAEELTAGWLVKVDADGHGSAEVTAPDIDTALRMAVPYMAVVSQPDPLAALFMRPSAPDGPGDEG